MVLSDYLSRQTGDKSDLHQVIPISFNIKDVSLKPCQDKAQDTFMVQTRSQAKGVKSPAKWKSTDSMHKKAQDIKPIIIEDDDDQDISNQKGDKVSTSRDGTSHVKPPNLPNQVYPQPIIRPPLGLQIHQDQIPRLQQKLKETLILKRIPPIWKA